jgi:hypothetical protein
VFEIPAPSRVIPAESPDETAVPAAESLSFAAAMRDVSPSYRTPSSQDARRHADTGNGLPALPEPSAGRRGPSTAAGTDLDLEEFAVGMGINRDLARLLLSETASVAAEGTDFADDPKASADVETAVIAPETDRRGVTEQDAPVPMSILAVAMPPPVAVVQVPPALSTALPIADEDLMMLRATVSRSEVLGATLPARDEPTPGDASPFPSSLGELRFRTLVAEAPVAVGNGAAATERPRPDLTLSLAPTAPLPSGIAVTSLPTGAVAPAVISTDVAVEANLAAARFTGEPTMASGIGRAPLSIRKQADSSVSSSTRQDSMLTTAVGLAIDPHAAVLDRDAVMPGATIPMGTPADIEILQLTGRDIAPSAAQTGLGTATAPGATLAGPSTADPPAAETARTLVMPDPRLTIGERVQAFADAVAQRVLAQIREDDWNVSLQLEPANMGTVDIDLTLRGTAVAANVGVANGEVRALLESGLPRLRDSLESAGLQLAGWTFGQSGSRPFNGAAQPWTSSSARRNRIMEIDDGHAADALRAAAVKETSARKVDLFV